MRSKIRDLIDELDRQAGKFDETGVVVGFQDHARFVWASDGAKGEKVAGLNKLVELGGEPIGYVGIRITEDSGAIHLRPLKAYEADEKTLAYLMSLQGVIGRVLAAKGLSLSALRHADGWLG